MLTELNLTTEHSFKYASGHQEALEYLKIDLPARKAIYWKESHLSVRHKPLEEEEDYMGITTELNSR